MRNVVLSLMMVLVCISPTVNAQGGSKGEAIVDQLLKSTVLIITPLAEPRGSIGKDGIRVLTLANYAIGTGVYIGTSDQGNPVILTNYHVVRGGYSVRVVFASENPRLVGASYSLAVVQDGYQRGKDIKLLAKSTTRDLALLEVMRSVEEGKKVKGAEPLPLASQSARPGAEVHTMGCTPAAGLFSYTQGAVRSVGQREFQILDDRSKTMNKMELVAIETTNPLNKGDSGGPLVNAQIELVGIAQSKCINASLVSVFVDRHELAPYLDINKIKLAEPRKVVVAANRPNPNEKEPPVNAKVNDKAKNDKVGAPRSEEVKRSINETVPTNFALKPMAPITAGPQSCIAFQSGYIACLPDKSWGYEEFINGGIKSGKLTIKSQKDDETLFADDQNKVYYRLSKQGLERSPDEKDWKVIDSKAKWNP
ncbi:MAG TPA: serine protease [Gemmatales bacterium]|nr:serine protease [Gemmatales bacterium]